MAEKKKKQPPAKTPAKKSTRTRRSPARKKQNRQSGWLFFLFGALSAIVVGLFALTYFAWTEAEFAETSSPFDQAMRSVRKAERSPSARPSPTGAASQQSSGGNGVSADARQKLLYEEPLHFSLSEQIHQVDYALIQALLRTGLTFEAMEVAGTEPATAGKEQFSRQRLNLLVESKQDEFWRNLKEALWIWAPEATCERLSATEWDIRINGSSSHVLRLFSDRKAFFAQERLKLPPADKKRVRAPGEPARLVIVMDDLGANLNAVRELLRLEYPVTFAFWPQAAYTRQGAKLAHEAGREIIVHQPMEPMRYPQMQPGPGALFVRMQDREIRHLVEESLRQVPFAVGLNNHMGSRFTQSPQGVRSVLAVLQKHGLFMLDSLTHYKSVFYDEARKMHVRAYRRNVFLDDEHGKVNVLEKLRQAEKIALLTGEAIAIGHPLPETLAALREWQKLRNREVQIVSLQSLQR